MSAAGDSLPVTAACPCCGELVALPVEPPDADTPPTFCTACEFEIPDFRRDSYLPSGDPGLPPVGPFETATAMDRKFSRGGLFKSLGGLVADRGIEAVDAAKERFNG